MMVTSRIFAEHKNCYVVAPAGYGKTYLLVDALNFLPEKELILTHTNAGVGAIMEKIKLLKIQNKKYSVFTLDGFMMLLIRAYVNPKDFPLKSNGEWDYEEAKALANKLLTYSVIKEILEISFSGVLVDEYQDCSLLQHEFILQLKKFLPIRIVGDPMQSIFGWRNRNNKIVDMDNLDEEFEFLGILDTPHRWNETAPKLGQEISEIRTLSSHQKDPHYVSMSSFL